MPLRDHFHPPLVQECPWETLHADWATMIAHRLNESLLPERYVARQHVHLGAQVEVDIATLDKAPFTDGGTDSRNGGVATAVEVWAPPEPPLTATVRFAEPDLYEIQVFRQSGGAKLVAAIELVSEANKDRPEARRTFAVKCASYLSKGVSVVVVDIVTTRLANLHAELADLLELPEALRWDSPGNLSAIVYRVVRVDQAVKLDVWPYPVAIGSELATVPLWLAADLAVPLELERTYNAALAGQRLL